MKLCVLLKPYAALLPKQVWTNSSLVTLPSEFLKYTCFLVNVKGHTFSNYICTKNFINLDNLHNFLPKHSRGEGEICMKVILNLILNCLILFVVDDVQSNQNISANKYFSKSSS